MMAAAPSKDVKAAALVRADNDTQALPGFSVIGDRMVRGVRTMITEICHANPQIRLEPIGRMTFGDWRAQRLVAAGLCRFKIKPLKGQLLIVMPAKLIAQLVDCYYGGEGAADNERLELSKAECRFVERIGETLTSVISAAWSDISALTPDFVGIETDMAQISFVKDADRIIVQTLTLSGVPFGPFGIDCIYPAAALRSVKALSENRSGEDPVACDTIWQERLREAMMQVSLPVRTIFARTELPLTKLLSLQAGDMIPICLPNRIPVTVCGFTFAEATVGESNGRASIRIEKLEQGLARND